MPRKTSYTYDPSSGKWSSSTTNSGSNNSISNTGSSNNSGGNNTSSGNSGGGSNSNGNLSSSNTDNKSATGSTEKKVNYIEINTLIGTLNFIVTPQTIKLKAGDTVNLLGLGKYLSGKYYVKDVTRSISSDNGYEHSATVIKTDFGSKLKKVSKKNSKKKKKKKKKTTKKVKSSKSKSKTPKRYYVVKSGDTLYSIAAKYYGKGSNWEKISKANNNVSCKAIKVGQKLVIP